MAFLMVTIGWTRLAADIGNGSARREENWRTAIVVKGIFKLTLQSPKLKREFLFVRHHRLVAFSVTARDGPLEKEFFIIREMSFSVE